MRWSGWVGCLNSDAALISYVKKAFATVERRAKTGRITVGNRFLYELRFVTEANESVEVANTD